MTGRPVSDPNATVRIERALERADVGVDPAGDQLQRGRVDARDAVLLHALAQDRQARLVVGRAHVADQAGLEALAQPVLERRHVAREPVRGQHDLRPGRVQRVEGVEELLLRLRLALEELDVVDEQDADVAVGALEGVDAVVVQGADEVVRERLDGRVAHGQPVAVGRDVVGDRVQQVRLAEPGRAADEERVVGERRHLGDGQRGAVGEAVGVADDELVEREAGVEGDVGRRPQRARAPAAAPRRAAGSSGPTSSTATSWPSTRCAPAWSTRLKRSLTHARLASGALTTSVEPSSRRASSAVEIVLPGVVRDRASGAPPGCAARNAQVRRSRWTRRLLLPRRGRWIGRAEGPRRPRRGEYNKGCGGPPGGCPEGRRKTRTNVPASTCARLSTACARTGARAAPRYPRRA